MAKKSNLPVSIDELERQVAAVAKPSAVAQVAAEPTFSSGRIIRASNSRQFKFEDNVLPRPLKVVVLSASHIQAYYDTKYDPENKTPPVCFAQSGPASKDEMYSKTNFALLLAPHETAPSKQHEICATCPQNKPGSGELGGFTRACSGRRRLAVLSLDDKSDDPSIFTMEISASGLRDYTLHFNKVAQVESLPSFLVATAIDFFDKKDSWFLKCEHLGRLTQFRPDWVTPKDGVKIGSDDWLDHTLVGKKLIEALESKVLLAPPSTQAPEKGKKKGKTAGKPVTGVARMSVKDAKKLRKK